MVNLKHAVSALAAAAMVSSLAVNQAANFTFVDAQKTFSDIQNVSPEVLKGDAGDEQKEEKRINYGYVLISEGVLEMKEEASEDSDTVAELSCAEEVIIIAEYDEWYHVQYGTITGYVKAEYITDMYSKYESGYINTDGTNIRDGAGVEGTNVIDRQNSGTLVFVAERIGADWVKVWYGKDYDIGYVSVEYITIDGTVDKDDIVNAKKNRVADSAESGKVSSNGVKLDVRAMPSENAEIIGELNDGEKLSIISKENRWTKIVIGDSVGFINSAYAFTDEELAQRAAALEESKKKSVKTEKQVKSEPQKTENVSAGGQAIVNKAAEYIGIRYVYGGASPSTGFDCSGLVQYVCKNLGISVNRSSRDQYKNGVAVARENLQPGDLVFFSKGNGISHVVIYAGDGKVIHAPSAGKTVCYTTLSHICSYSTYVGARRVV